jgi:ubiquinol-cytochrome c reductase cytochrome c subunit
MEVGLMISKIRGRPFWIKFAPILLLSILGFLAACTSAPANAPDGQRIFAENCSGCHTIGRGDLTGPDLKGVTAQQAEQWLVNFISNPQQVISSADPTATALVYKYHNIIMPNMKLTNPQVLAVITFIRSASGTSGEAAPVTSNAAQLPLGDAQNGKALFLGWVTLENGAPECIGCHNANNTGILGGGTLGPNLTNVYTKYGEAGLEGILSHLPFLSMRPEYVAHPLTDQEKADLLAFFKITAGQPEVNQEPIIIGISLAGFLLIIGAVGFYWRNRLTTVRQELVNRARKEK